MYSVHLESRSLLTPDGIRLDADVYFPQGRGEFPVLLMRQPYGRTIASTVVYAHPRWYAQQGYIVVIQDVRGRGTSEGEFQLFAQEGLDGAVTVNWAAELPGSSGAVGMYGFSYQGMTQLYAAMGQSHRDCNTSALKTLCPAMLAADLYADWAYEGGAFCWQLNLAWAIQLAAETARRSGDEEGFAALFQASRHLPVEGASPPGLPEVLCRYAPDSFYFDWLRHSDPMDPYWQALNPDVRAIDLPMLHIGGWFDPYLRGTLNLYHQMKRQSCHLQHLWIGPWTHLPWGQQAGAVNFGSAAQTPIDRLQLRWFDQFLKGQDTGLLTEDPVHCFDLGQKIWRTAGDFPPLSTSSETIPSTYTGHTWHLINTGLAALRTDEGLMVSSGSGASGLVASGLVASGLVVSGSGVSGSGVSGSEGSDSGVSDSGGSDLGVSNLGGSDSVASDSVASDSGASGLVASDSGVSGSVVSDLGVSGSGASGSGVSDSVSSDSVSSDLEVSDLGVSDSVSSDSVSSDLEVSDLGVSDSVSSDSVSSDLEVSDLGVSDSVSSDSVSSDLEVSDLGVSDSVSSDLGASGSGVSGSGVSGSGVSGSGASDSGASDLGVSDLGVSSPVPETIESVPIESCSAFLVQDPWRPVPALGGHGVIPGGSFNRQSLDDRSDVVTFTTAPLVASLDLWGSVEVALVLQSPNPSFDVCAVLSVVRSGGEGVFNLSQGYRRVMSYTPSESVTLTVNLQPICCRIAVGECLRLSLSAACFPAYALNPGTGQDPHGTSRQAAQVITLEIQGGQLKVPLRFPLRVP
jgi:predicted acyl esterase